LSGRHGDLPNRRPRCLRRDRRQPGPSRVRCTAASTARLSPPAPVSHLPRPTRRHTGCGRAAPGGAQSPSGARLAGRCACDVRRPVVDRGGAGSVGGGHGTGHAAPAGPGHGRGETAGCHRCAGGGGTAAGTDAATGAQVCGDARPALRAPDAVEAGGRHPGVGARGRSGSPRRGRPTIRWLARPHPRICTHPRLCRQQRPPSW
jgi:hypothetical protein